MIEAYLKEDPGQRLVGVVLPIKTILNYMAVFIIFAAGWRLNILSFAELRLSYFIMAPILLIWILFLKGIYFHKIFLLLFIIIALPSFYTINAGSNSLSLFTKQFVGIFLNAIFFYLLLKVNHYDVKKLFKIYLNIAFIVALIGILQVVSYRLGFKAGYDFGYLIPGWTYVVKPTFNLPRLNSILPEPSYYCTVVIPAFFISIVSFLKNNFNLLKKWKGCLIIISFLLTFSTAGYLAVFFALGLLAYSYRKVRYLIIAGLVIALLAGYAYKNISDFRMRIDVAREASEGKAELEKTDASSFAFHSNVRVAHRIFLDSPIFGGGLGSYQISYYKYIGSVIDIDEITTGGFLNVKDACSLFLRLLSETGLLGLSVILIFIFRYYTPRVEGEGNYLWIINNAALSMFFIKLLRMGHYFIDGFFFFLWLYYFSKIGLNAIKRGAKP